MPAVIRPTQNMARKAIFDLIGHDLMGLEFLELFAGSGSVGFEALSLGARSVTLVERDPQCISVIQENLRRLGINTQESELGSCELLEKDAYATIKEFARQERRFDIIFADPPYGRGMAKKTLKSLMAYDILRANCLLVLQYHIKDRKQEIVPDMQGQFSLITQRTYGASAIDVYRRL
jgi:16S rRNA (guanine(966)-N(2))-methyltransferase RsmD